MKALGLLSGGLDSTLAARILIEQGIEVSAINFTSPFCTCTAKGASCAAVVTAVRQLGDIPLKRVALGDEYLRMVRKPEHGRGRGMNPCIDCRIMKIRKAGEYMHRIGASFLFTGEVLGQRPMSQHRRALALIDRESGFGDRTLRPLSAMHLPPTVPEQRGWVNRAGFLGLSGKTRRPQMALAAEKGIADYPCPAGGCRLTDRHFAERLSDYFAHTESPSINDMALLRVGRHFRAESLEKVVVARNEGEGEMLKKLAGPDDHLLVPLFPAPVVLLRGREVGEALCKLRRYSKLDDVENPSVVDHYRGSRTMLPLTVS